MAIKNKYVKLLILLTVYSLIYFYYSGMYPWNFTTELPGAFQGDLSVFLWNSFHLSEWLQGNQPFFSTDLIFAPFGTDLYLHTYSHLLAAAQVIAGNKFLGANLVLWLHYIFSGIGAYLLGRHFKLPFYWAFIAGFLFAFAPYKFMHYTGHYNLQETAFIPFFILQFFKAFPQNTDAPLFSKLSLKKTVSLLLIGLLCLLSSYVYAAFIFFFVVGYFIYFSFYRFIPSAKYRLLTFIALTIMVSFIVPWFNKMGLDHSGGLWFCDDFAKYLTPNWNSTLYHYLLPDIYNNYGRLEIKNGDGFLGFLIPALVFFLLIFSLVKQAKNPAPRVLIFMSVFFFMLTLPDLTVFKTKLFYFPTSIYHFVPVINNLRIPDRFVILLALFLPILLFYVWHHYFGYNKKIRYLFPILFFAIFFAEFHQTSIGKAQRKDVPAWTKLLGKLPQGNVLLLPTGINDGSVAEGHFTPDHLYYQTMHKHKLIGGYVSRITKELRQKFRKDPVMNEILERSGGIKPANLLDKNAVEKFIADYEVKYVFINKNENRFDDLIRAMSQRGFADSVLSGDDIIYQIK